MSLNKILELTPAELFDQIVLKKIRVQPVLSIKGDVDWWSAGYTEVTITGQNVINIYRSGKTPQEAVTKLLQVKRAANRRVTTEKR